MIKDTDYYRAIHNATGCKKRKDMEVNTIYKRLKRDFYKTLDVETFTNFITGESIDFIARRLVILASEDIGLADPMGLVIATNAMNAVRQIGMPESRIILSEATLYLANAKKSNSSIMAIDSAIESVRNISIKQIPPHLQDAHYNDADTIGRGVGYKYPHNYDNHFVEQQYLPDELINKEFYIPSNQGAEKKIIKRQKEN